MTEANSREKDAPRIGVDEWVSQVDRRKRQRQGIFGVLANGWDAIPLALRYGLIALLLLIAPIVTNTTPILTGLNISDNAFIVRLLAQFLISAMLAIGLNVVVGYAGLLDLGYVAFYGVAGYAYAYLSSDFVQFGGLKGIHLPALLSVPLIIAFTMLVGWLLGFISLRLSGDYLSIITLGFGLVFINFVLAATRIQFWWLDHPVDLTRGPNGINDLDHIALFGYRFESTLQNYYLFFVLLVLVYITVHNLNQSRLGRAWRSMREDELAAEVMGMPTRRLKLMAFAIGAGIAALVACVDAGWQGNVVPNPRYSVVTLINLYAMIVLGGIGSLPGVVLGAFIFTVVPEALRSVQLAGLLFYGMGLIGLISWLRPVKRLIFVLGGTILGGLLLKEAVVLLWPSFATGAPPDGSVLNQLVQRWLLIPKDFAVAGNVAAGSALLLLLLTLLLKSHWRWWLLGVTIYLFAFAWETRLVAEPAATRILIVGATLVVMMIVRPQGLLGKAEVKVV